MFFFPHSHTHPRSTIDVDEIETSSLCRPQKNPKTQRTMLERSKVFFFRAAIKREMKGAKKKQKK